MAITKETDHVGKGLGRILEVLKKPKIEGWIRSYLAEGQALEDALFDVLTLRLLDSAEGEQLDVLGRIVGQARGPYTDSQFRAFLRGRIRANRSSGDINALLEIVALIFVDETATVSFREEFPAAVIIIVNEVLAVVRPEDVFAILTVAKAAAVRLTLEYETASPTFAFFDYAGPSTVDGLGDSADASVGGTFASVLST